MRTVSHLKMRTVLDLQMKTILFVEMEMKSKSKMNKHLETIGNENTFRNERGNEPKGGKKHNVQRK